MIEALRLMRAQGAELYILSDANTVYIETALKVCQWLFVPILQWVVANKDGNAISVVCHHDMSLLCLTRPSVTSVD